jgi:hypothetical protein
MSGHVYSQAAQLLNEAPDFGAVGGNVLRDLGPAHDHRGVSHEQAHDLAKADVGTLYPRLVGLRTPASS